MYRIKLLILLLVNFFLYSCATTHITHNSKFSISYIGGEYDGLILKNYLEGHISSLDLLDQNSPYEIRANFNITKNVYITNIDNTSDRENITTTIYFSIYDKDEDCLIYNDTYVASQFYIYVSSDKYFSNRTALEKIKKENSEALVKEFISKIQKIEMKCNGK